MHISVTAAAAGRERGRTRTDADHVALSWTLRVDRIGRGAAANALQLTFRRRRRRSVGGLQNLYSVDEGN